MKPERAWYRDDKEWRSNEVESNLRGHKAEENIDGRVLQSENRTSKLTLRGATDDNVFMYISQFLLSNKQSQKDR